ncbi:BEL1-like homeodomain protein 8 [Linum grandiflorum]
MAEDSSLQYYYTTSPNPNQPPDIRRVTNLSEFISSNPFEFGHHHHQRPTLDIEGYQDVVLGHDMPYTKGLSLSLASNSNNNINHRREFRAATSCSGNGNGPLGPFTGYATILKNSRFLRPAQDLMDQWCGTTTVMAGSGATFVAPEHFVGSGGCSSSSHGVTDFYEMKARLSYLLEEVCKRYKVYNQQIQMVVSSFESVAGLGSSTPYASLAFKSMSRKFKSMKQVILEQLRHVTKVLGDELVGRQIVGPSNLGFFHEAQHHVYKSQRGLPERSVAVLRAWLFEHFLHPYPTDVDKHYLATQTGLTRNQVSNWFINARVRIWKPMVEEIHKLESHHNLVDHPGPSNSTAEHDYHGFGPSSSSIGHEQGQVAQHQGKRSRVEFIQVPMNNNVNTIGNSVSLTLGLRHGFAENVSQHHQHQHQRLQEHEDRMRREFGVGYGGMVHDFCG